MTCHIADVAILLLLIHFLVLGGGGFIPFFTQYFSGPVYQHELGVIPPHSNGLSGA